MIKQLEPIKVGDCVRPPSHPNGRGGKSHYGLGIVVSIHGPICQVCAELSYSDRVVTIPLRAADLKRYTPRTEHSKTYVEELRKRYLT
jgi:hypothetical protein